MVVDEIKEGLSNDCFRLGFCTFLISEKFPNTVSQLLQEALIMDQQWCGKSQFSTHPQNVQHLNQNLMKPGHLS
jgi:hypothetical protein